MKISVAMCTFNGARYLPQQLDSFLDQSRLPDEIVVCDDRSTDGTIAILEAFAQRAPFPVRLLQNETNLGSTRNFIQAISLCDGDAIALSDQDDYWKPAKLSVLSKVLENDSTIGGVFSDGDLIDGDSHPIGKSLWQSVGYTPGMQANVGRGHPLEVLKKQYFITGATLIFRSEMRRYFMHIPPEWIHDAWMTWQIAIHSKIVGVPAHLIGYRLHGNNLVGINTQSAAELLEKRTAAQMIALLEKELRQLRPLQTEIGAFSTPRAREALGLVERRMQYLQDRLNVVSQSRAARPLYTLAIWRQYAEFGKGLRSMIGDIAL
jgi:glycosyltransferase involved in cell wall biosynthesis